MDGVTIKINNRKSIEIYSFSRLTKLPLPEWQRDEIAEHSNEIYKGLKQQYNLGFELLVPGQIAIVYNLNSEIYKLIDGNHRVCAIKRLIKKYPDIANQTTDVGIYTVNSSEEEFEIYQMINQNEPVRFQKSINREIFNRRVERYFKGNFSNYIKTSTTPQRPNFNLETVMEKISSINFIDLLNIESADFLIERIDNLNEFYSDLRIEDWNKTNLSFKIGKIIELKNYENVPWIFLYKNFEWIQKIIDNTPYHQQKHFFDEKVNKGVGQKIRKELWKKNFGDIDNEGCCHCCHNPVFFENYHAGHIISVSKGGQDHLNNLKVLCADCNLAMGTLDMETWMTIISREN